MTWLDRTPGAAWVSGLQERLRTGERVATGVCLAGLCGLIFAFYYRLWLPGQILIRRDVFRFYAPAKQYMAERLLAGELPEWFPYEALGRSFLSAPVTGVFHPFTVLYLLFPAHDVLRAITLFMCLLAGLGAYGLGRMLQLSRLGAILTGLVFSCSGYVASITDNPPYLYSICLLPFFCVAMHRALAGNVAWGVASAVIWASVFLQGDVQTGYYYGFIGLFWMAAVGTVPVRLACVRLIGVGALAGLLGAIQLAPAAAAFLDSTRAHPGFFYSVATSWSTHPLRLLTMVASPLESENAEVEVAKFFFGVSGNPNGFMALSLYVGMPVAGLAALGGWYRKDLRGVVLLGCAALWLALGHYGGLYGMLYHTVPLWSAFRYPEKLMGVVTLAIAVLAGAGLDECRRGGVHLAWWTSLALLCLAGWMIFEAEATGLWMAGYFEAPLGLARRTADAMGAAFQLSAFATLGAGVLVASLHRTRVPERALVAVLVLVVMLDLSRVNQDAYRTGPADIAREVPLFVRILEGDAGAQAAEHVRVFPRPQSVFFYPEQPLSFTGVLAFIMRQALYTDLGAEYHIESISPYLPGYGAPVRALADLILEDALDARALARLNVGYVIGDDRLFAQPPFSEMVLGGLPSYRLALVKNPVVPSPRAYLSRRPQRADAAVGLRALMRRPDFLSGAIDVIEAPQGTLPGPLRDGKVRIERYQPETVHIGVETSTPAVLVLIDAYAAGWRAVLEDGTELPVWRANALARAVVVPAGAHRVTFSYRTPLLAAGAWCSFAGVLVCSGMLWRAWRAERRRGFFQERAGTSPH